MSLLRGSLSFRRFRVYQALPEDFRDVFVENIQRMAFRENLKSRSKEPVFGWVNLFEPGDTEFTLNNVLFDRYLILGLRVDKKTIDSKLFAVELQRQFRAEMQARGVDRLGKGHREDIKEALTEEVRGKMLPRMNVYDLIWDIHTGEVLVFATSDATCELVQFLFHDTFNMHLYPERLVDWLAESMTWESIAARAAELPGGSACSSVVLNEDGSPGGNPIDRRETFLAAEFLEWLWCISEVDFGEMMLSLSPRSDETDQITVWIDDQMAFESKPGEDLQRVRWVGGAPSTNIDATLFLAAGKLPVLAQVGLRRGESEWLFQLRAAPEGLRVTHAKLPSVIKEGLEEMLYERMYLLNTLFGALKAMAAKFFRTRTSPAWEALIPTWLKSEAA